MSPEIADLVQLFIRDLRAKPPVERMDALIRHLKGVILALEKIRDM